MVKDILDPDRLWLGTPGRALSEVKRPLAVADTLTVAADSATTLVDVLANDIDFAGGGLTLVSATAAIGTASIQGNQVGYKPAIGVSGPDTVVYSIVDIDGRPGSGQINVTVEDAPLSIDRTIDERLEVTAQTGSIDLTVSSNPAFDGSFSFDVGDLTSGPVNLAPPTLSGTHGAGDTLTAARGLWAHDTGSTPLRSWQWQDDGVDIAGATSDSLTLTTDQAASQITVTEVLSDTQGTRLAVSPPSVPPDPLSYDANLIAWWDATDDASIADISGTVTAWTDKANTITLTTTPTSRQPRTGVRQLNGLNVIDYDGTEFNEAPLTLPATGDVAIHMVVVIDTVSSEFVGPLALEATNDFQIDANDPASFAGRLNVAGIGSSVALSGGPFSGAIILSAVFDRTGAATAEVYIDGVQRGSTAYTAPVDASVALHLMTNRSKNIWLDGAVAEVIVTSDVSNRAAHHGYLAAKWGL